MFYFYCYAERHYAECHYGACRCALARIMSCVLIWHSINDALSGVSVTELFYSSSLTQRRNKLDRFPLQVFSGKSNVGV